MKKVDSYHALEMLKDTVRFQFKYIHGETEHFQMKRSTLRDFFLNILGNSQELVISNDDVGEPEISIARANQTGRLLIQIRHPRMKQGVDIVLGTLAAENLGQNLLKAAKDSVD